MRYIDKFARQYVRDGLSGDPSFMPNFLWERCNLAESERQGAFDLLSTIYKNIDINLSKIDPQAHLRDVLRIPKEDLPQISDQLWESEMYDKVVEVFGYELLEILLQNVTRRRVNEIRKTLVPQPNNEEEWIDAIMNMTVCQLISTFSKA